MTTISSTSNPDTPNDLVSIVIPCFNQGHFLAETIESAISQTYHHCEITVVNDGSTDDTSAIALRSPGVRLIEQPNSGVAAARNTGLRASRGTFAVFLDADDRLLPEAAASGVGLLQKDPQLAFVYGHVQLVDHLGNPLQSPEQKAVTENHYVRLLKENYIWTPGAIIYRAEAVRAIGGFDTRFFPAEDLELNYRILRRYPAACNDRAVLQYRLHHNNATKSPDLMLRSYLSVLKAEAMYLDGRDDMVTRLQRHRRLAQKGYGKQLAVRFKYRLLHGQIGKAMNDLLTLMQLYPAGVFHLMPSRIQRWRVRLGTRES